MTGRAIRRRPLGGRATTVALALLAFFFTSPGHGGSQEPAHPAERPASPQLDGSIPNRDDPAIEFLQRRVESDPLDFMTRNKLAQVYLRRLRETGDHTYLERAEHLARESLAAFPAEVNPGGLEALARVELGLHNFAEAARHARRLMELDPGKSYPFVILGDALLESGDYEGAEGVYQRLEQRDERDPGMVVTVAVRLGRLAWLNGRSEEASQQFAKAIAAAGKLPPGNEETLAWCLWQTGEMAFAQGDYSSAANWQLEALEVRPDDFRAKAALARIRAAQGDRDGAITLYEQAIRLNPHLTYVAALGDLHELTGHRDQVARLHARVEAIGLGQDHDHGVNGDDEPHEHPQAHAPSPWPSHNARDFALFYADHDLKADFAYDIAKREYEKRQDIYTADAVAWTALKAGDVDEAREAIGEALRLGTRDARLIYHAGMIAHGAGDVQEAKKKLQRARAEPRVRPTSGRGRPSTPGGVHPLIYAGTLRAQPVEWITPLRQGSQENSHNIAI